jgi:NADPH-dependent F420 reductase
MKIAVVGGTGDFGRGLVMRWAVEHEMILGSRRADGAEKSAEEIGSILKGRGIEAKITGMENCDAIKVSDLVVLSIPYEFARSMVMELKDSFTDQIVISPIVPMARVGKRFEYTPPAEGSAALLVRDLLPPSVKVVAAFHTVSSSALQNLDRTIEGDVLIAGDDSDSKEVVADLVRIIDYLRPLDAGDLKVANQIEGLTPLLLNIGKLKSNAIKCPGITVLSSLTEKKTIRVTGGF